MSVLDDLDPLLAREGWPFASTTPVEAGDPGRFHALFGRDALITSLQLLPARPEVALATLRELAARRGREQDPGTLEEPGKIGHEFRDRAPEEFLAIGWPDEGGFRYYGTADATSWFLVVLAATGDSALAEELQDAWRAAAGWLTGALERGGGLVRHGPGTLPALTQQGWRDTVDPSRPEGHGGGILRADGTVPAPPLADADSQAAAHAALLALTVLDPAGRWDERAAALRATIASAFETDTMAVEADGRRVRGAGSQLGWLLWAGALDGVRAEAAAARLCAPDLLTDHGLRTLSAESPVFAPDAYHRGAVWPFDSWIGWGGLRAAGRPVEAERVRSGVLAALDDLGRSPELYAVSAAGAVEPVPIANRVQAWTVGARWALAHEWDGRPPFLRR